MATIQALDNMFQFHQQALNLRAFRQELIASNIANADTPSYKARDIDFAEALRNATGEPRLSTPLLLNSTNDRHIGTSRQDQPAAVLYRSVQQPSIDGNTVDMDRERNNFAENAIHYDAGLTFLNDHIKMVMSALRD